MVQEREKTCSAKGGDPARDEAEQVNSDELTMQMDDLGNCSGPGVVTNPVLRPLCRIRSQHGEASVQASGGAEQRQKGCLNGSGGAGGRGGGCGSRDVMGAVMRLVAAGKGW